MKLPLRSQNPALRPGVVGPARVDRRIGAVLSKASSGDVVFVDHLDLDRGHAEALLDRGVVAVVDAAALISGRYPNLGPELLAKSGVVLVDNVGSGIFNLVKDGVRVRIHEGCVLAGDEVVAEGRHLMVEDVQRLMDQARDGLGSQLQSFTHNTTEFLRREQQLLLHGVGVPQSGVPMSGRPVVVVVRGFDHQADLRRIRPFVREQRPVLVGVDGGADALLAVRLKPDVVVLGDGSGQSVSDRALTTAREVVLHTDRSGQALGADRLDRLGVRPQRMMASGTTEDVALLLADTNGASVIITVGTHATLDEFLDRQRAGLASTFLTRLRIGPRLVDAKGVPALYAGRVRLWHLLAVLLFGLLALAAALTTTPQFAPFGERLGDAFGSLTSRAGGAGP